MGRSKPSLVGYKHTQQHFGNAIKDQVQVRI